MILPPSGAHCSDGCGCGGATAASTQLLLNKVRQLTGLSLKSPFTRRPSLARRAPTTLAPPPSLIAIAAAASAASTCCRAMVETGTAEEAVAAAAMVGGTTLPDPSPRRPPLPSLLSSSSSSPRRWWWTPPLPGGEALLSSSSSLPSLDVYDGDLLSTMSMPPFRCRWSCSCSRMRRCLALRISISWGDQFQIMSFNMRTAVYAKVWICQSVNTQRYGYAKVWST